jgi:N-acetyl-anhydromuramyl-L-alanine amidase AmpD
VILTGLFFILLLTSCANKGQIVSGETREINDEIDWQDVYYKRAPAAKGWKFIVIHHSATMWGNAKSFHEYHTKKGYGGLAYHFVIGNGNGAKDGEIQEGFRWKEQISGTHVTVDAWYHNVFGIGICLVGNFDRNRPTSNQIKSLVHLLKRLTGKYGIKRERVFGHGSVPHTKIYLTGNEILAKYLPGKKEMRTCPGKYFPMQKVLNLAFGD